MPVDHVTVRAPGRVNLLGEHVDYCGGPVLPVAIDRGIMLRCLRSPQRCLRLITDLGEGTRMAELDIDALSSGRDAEGRPMEEWARYPAGVGWALASEGYTVTPMTAAIRSNLPTGAGMSSSAAIEVAFALAWQALGGWEADCMSLAQVCQRAENQYVGVACGLMDQFAVLHGVEGHALLFDTRTLAWEPVPLPRDTVIVIADSGVRRELANSAYNERRASCEEALAKLRERIPGLQCLADVTPAELTKHADALSPTTLKRTRHVVEECERVRKGVLLLGKGDAFAFGRLMYESHASLRDLYEVSCEELNILVAHAYDLPGLYGARLTGAGFGGCTVNLVAEGHAEEFVRRLAEEYAKATGRQANVFATRAVDGAHVERPAP